MSPLGMQGCSRVEGSPAVAREARVDLSSDLATALLSNQLSYRVMSAQTCRQTRAGALLAPRETAGEGGASPGEAPRHSRTTETLSAEDTRSTHRKSWSIQNCVFLSEARLSEKVARCLTPTL